MAIVSLRLRPPGRVPCGSGGLSRKSDQLRADGPSEVALCQVEGADAHLRAGDATVEVVGRDVDAAPQPRLSRQVGSVVVRRPLQHGIDAGAVLEGEILMRGGVELAQAAGE